MNLCIVLIKLLMPESLTRLLYSTEHWNHLHSESSFLIKTDYFLLDPQKFLYNLKLINSCNYTETAQFSNYLITPSVSLRRYCWRSEIGHLKQPESLQRLVLSVVHLQFSKRVINTHGLLCYYKAVKADIIMDFS